MLYQYVQQPGSTWLSMFISCLQPLPQVGYNELKSLFWCLSTPTVRLRQNCPATIGVYVDPAIVGMLYRPDVDKLKVDSLLSLMP